MNILTNMNKKKIFIIVLSVFLLVICSYFTKGAYDYYGWLKTKEVIAGGGFTNLYAGTLGVITLGCTPSSSGCTCSFCNTCGCGGYNQALITMGQEVNKGAQYLCVNAAVQVKGTPIVSASGKQFMAGSLAGQCLTGNAVMATPSLAATNFERLIGLINNYIIAGFKDKIK